VKFRLVSRFPTLILGSFTHCRIIFGMKYGRLSRGSKVLKDLNINHREAVFQIEGSGAHVRGSLCYGACAAVSADKSVSLVVEIGFENVECAL